MIAVLYVDDEPALPALARLFLEETGAFSVDTALSAEEAIAGLAGKDYDAVVSDYQMAGMDGIGLLKHVRTCYGTMPFILVTGRGREDVAMMAINNGADFYLQKGGDPVAQFVELANQIRQAVRRRRAEEALRTSEEQFRGIAERSSDLILVLDRHFSPIYVSPSVTRILGYRPDEVIGRSLDTTIMPQYDIDLVQEATTRAATERREGEIEIHITRKDGLVATLAAHGIPIMEDGSCIGVQVQAHDITARKQAEEALLRANRQLNILSTVTRHDIMNTIMVLRGYCGIAQGMTRDPEMLRVIGEMESVARILNDQIEFTRVYKDLGSQAPRWQEITAILPCEHVPAGISFTADVTGVEVFADAMLGKVFFNLLDNSLRHGGHATAIRISCAETAAGLAIAWEDNGIGIPAVEKERIFDRGYGKNTGLGLFIAREILAISGIGIAENGRYLRGVRFEIMVPKGGYRWKKTA